MSSRSVAAPRPLRALELITALALATLVVTPVAAKSGKSTTVWSESHSEGSSHVHSYSYDSDDSAAGSDDGGIDAYVFTRDNGRWNNGSGSEEDWQEARDARPDGDAPTLWLRHGEDRYLITDGAVLKRAAEIFRPQEELGRQQAELGGRQAELGRYQGELGRLQGQIGRKEADLAQERAYLQAAATYDGRGKYEREYAALVEEERELHAMQSELGERQSKLGAKQSALGSQQGELGRQQARVGREVSRNLADLLKQAIASGKAKRL